MKGKKNKKNKKWKWKAIAIVNFVAVGIAIYSFGITPMTICSILRLVLRAL